VTDLGRRDQMAEEQGQTVRRDCASSQTAGIDVPLNRQCADDESAPGLRNQSDQPRPRRR